MILALILYTLFGLGICLRFGDTEGGPAATTVAVTLVCLLWFPLMVLILLKKDLVK